MIGICSKQVECSKELQCGTDQICPIIFQGHSKWIEDIVISLKGYWNSRYIGLGNQAVCNIPDKEPTLKHVGLYHVYLPKLCW